MWVWCLWVGPLRLEDWFRLGVLVLSFSFLSFMVLNGMEYTRYGYN